MTLPLLLPAACYDAGQTQKPNISGEAIEAHVAFLTDDLFEGAPEALGSEVRAVYKSTRYHKAIELDKHGAVGVIYIQHRLVAAEGNRVTISIRRRPQN